MTPTPPSSRNVMERDAPTSLSPADVVPPIAWETTRSVAVAGLALTAVAALLGLVAAALGNPPWVLNTVRLVLVFAGAVTAGVAISFRADLWQTWALGALTAQIASFGTPGHWDSFRLLFDVLTVVAAARAVLVVLPAGW